MGGGVSKKVLRQELEAVRADRQELADALAAREAELAAKGRALKARARDAKRLRDQVASLVDSKAAMERALTENEGKRAATDASLFAITAKSEEDRSKIAELEDQRTEAERQAAMQAMTRQRLEAELASSHAYVSRLTASLDKTGRALASCEHTLSTTQSKLREEIENGRLLARGVIDDADRRIREVQETHTDVGFLRAKLVSVYLGEVCGDAPEHGAHKTRQGQLLSQTGSANVFERARSRTVSAMREAWQDVLPGAVPWHDSVHVKAKARDWAELPVLRSPPRRTPEGSHAAFLSKRGQTSWG
eukprot:Tamp_19275.p1 GENE.Tamp_19275~~Tamp_19275.p1  ORF type:complete len:342 (+),score=56.64 Tamp_19275:114-1028(+)